jgi:hypothetical protein
MYRINVHLFSRNRTGKITEVFVNDKNLIAYPEYCIRSFFKLEFVDDFLYEI